jgi:hypothetical protein
MSFCGHVRRHSAGRNSTEARGGMRHNDSELGDSVGERTSPREPGSREAGEAAGHTAGRIAAAHAAGGVDRLASRGEGRAVLYFQGDLRECFFIL